MSGERRAAVLAEAEKVARGEQLEEEEVKPKYGRLHRSSLAEVKSKSVRFLVPGQFPLSAFTLVPGVGGLGKSTLLAGIAADESAGRLLGGKPHDVIVISYEDTAEEIWRPRILAAGGDVSRVHWVAVPLDDGGIVVLPEDLADLRQMVSDLDSRFVIVDPIIASINLELDGHRDQHVRNVIGKLHAMAGETRCCVAGVGHLNKGQSKDAYLRIGNSMAFYNAARSVVLVAKDEQEEQGDLRLVAQVKANWSGLKAVQRHRIEEVVLPDEIDEETQLPVVTSRMVFVEELVDFDVGDVLDQKKSNSDAKLVEAVVFLVHMLSDLDWHDSVGLVKLAIAQGISERTLRRAALEEIQVEHERRGFPSTSHWRFPSHAKGASSSPEGGGMTDASQNEASSHAKEALPTGTTVGMTGDAAQPSPSEASSVPVMPSPVGEGEVAQLEAVTEPPAVMTPNGTGSHAEAVRRLTKSGWDG